MRLRSSVSAPGNRRWRKHVGRSKPWRASPPHDHFYAFIPNGQAMNPYTHKNWEGTGVQPDVAIGAADALKVAQTAIVKDLLAKATNPDDKERFEQTLKQLDGGP